MKVEKNRFKKKTQSRKYTEFLIAKYGTRHGFEYYYSDIQKALEYVLASEHQNVWQIQIISKREILAHTMLIADDRLAQDQAYFGFFECTEDKRVFDLLWNEVKQLATTNGFFNLKGPINGTTWHPYRVIKSSTESEAFSSEPITEDYYYKFLRTAGKSLEVGFHSGARKNYDHIINATASDYVKLAIDGYKIEKVEIIDTLLLHKIYLLSSEVFNKNYGFVNISMTEFFDLYNPGKLRTHSHGIYIAKKDDEMLGFCSTILDEQKLIMKTIAIHSSLQGIGLGNALVHKVHTDAKSVGIKEIIYALIRDDNQVKKFSRTDSEIFREYVCFDFKLD